MALLALLFGLQNLFGQQTLSVRIASANDDMEEFIAGANQTQTVGALDAGSSDLEFGTEGSGNDPQLVGLRFTGINIPKGAIIVNAYIQFTVDATNKNTDPCLVHIKGEASDNPLTFDPTTPFNLSSRPKSSDSVSWNVSGATWATVGSAGTDQRTPDLSALIQSIVNRSAWSSGNALALYLYGSGTREVESFDGDAPKAALLLISYIVPQILNSRIAAADDDQEEWIAGANQSKTVGNLDAGSSDLELGTEASGNDPQMVGLRFTNINIPKGSKIMKAYVQFTVDANGKNSDPCKLYIKSEDNNNPLTFDPATPFNITSRPKSSDSIEWNVGGSSWSTVGAASAEQRTSDIAGLIQAIVNRSGWVSGNALALYLSGSGTREVESFDGDAPKAPMLVVEYLPLTTLNTSINAADDDMEEWIAGSGQTKTVGALDAASSDLEFGTESAGSDPQMVGLRFNNINLPAGMKVKNAYIQFTVDAIAKNNDPCNIIIKAENNDNPTTFIPTTNYDISSRAKSTDSVTWSVSGTSWGTVGSAGMEQRTADLTVLVNALLARKGWNSGNSMAFYLYGSGTREVESYDGDALKAPKLVLEYYGGTATAVAKPKMAVTSYPLNKKSEWAIHDSAFAPASDWKNDAYKKDSTWNYAKGIFGYGEIGFQNFEIQKGLSNNTSISAYFKKRFKVASLNDLSDTVEMQVMGDDGFVVYLNGSEVARRNMPAGAPVFKTKALRALEGTEERVYYLFYLPKSAFKADTNTIAVEVHQSDSLSSDMLFDLSLSNRKFKSNPAGLACVGNTSHIACFTSVLPAFQADTIILPASHKFQVLLKQGDAYSLGGTVPGNFDFTGYVPIKGSSRNAYVGLNHELGPMGGVSMLNVHYNCQTGKWVLDSTFAVDFTGSDLVRTERNCSGGVTPWGTFVSSEESGTLQDNNSDGYLDIGWNVEVDPKTRRVKEYGKGKREKLWAMGNMSHENVVFAKDSLTAYQGEDAGDGSVYKFVADKKTDFSKGKLYVLKLDQTLDSKGDPTGTTARWIQINNSTPVECNTTRAQVAALGGSFFNGVEDVEINPLNGEIFFTAKGVGRVYAFKDNGSTISNFRTFVGGEAYPVNYGSGVVMEDWGGGNDNLDFDDKGNLWVLQDGGKNHVWLVRPDHTQVNPKVELFMRTPTGSEPTGLTFSPDYQYMFLSIQSPNGLLSQKDVKGNAVVYNGSVMLVVARNEKFSPETIAAPSISGPASVNKNTVQTYSVPARAGASYTWTLTNGTQLSGGNSNSITVQWNSQTSGDVKVSESFNSQCSSSTAVLNVTLKTVGLYDAEYGDDLSLYPNPANTDEVRISRKVSGFVTDLSGKNVLSFTDTDVVSITALDNGVYFVRTSEGAVIRLIVNR